MPGLLFAFAIPVGIMAGMDPRIAVITAAGAAFVVIALADLSAALAIFAFLGFVVVVPNFGDAPVSVLKLAGVPLLLSWIGIVARQNERAWTFFSAHPVFTAVALVFVSWAALSNIWAEDAALAQLSVFRYALNLTLFMIVFAAVRRDVDLRRLAIGVAAGAAAAAAYGLLNPVATDVGQLARLSGAIGNPNDLAAALVLGVGASAGLAASSRSVPGRSAALVALGLCVAGVLLTASRGGLVAMIAMVLGALALGRGRRVALSLVSVVLLLGAAGYFLTTAPTGATERLIDPSGGTGRVDLWTVALRMVEDRPLQGVGTGSFAPSSIHYLLEPGILSESQYIANDPKVAHNMYLEVLAELGIPGAIMFIGIVLFCLGCAASAVARQYERGSSRDYALTLGLTASLVGLLTADFFGSGQYSQQLWLFLGLGPAMLNMTKHQSGPG